MKLTVVLVALVMVPLAAAAPEPPDDYRPLPVQGGVTAVSRIEPRLTAVAANLAGRVVEVRCWSAADWARLDHEWRAYRGTGVGGLAGYVFHSAPERLNLAPRTCKTLTTFIYKRTRPGDKTPVKRDRLTSALLTLTHEAQHSRGIRDEFWAECRGVQLVRPVARLLGATKVYSAFIAHSAWKREYGAGGAYATPDCRNGGPGDIHPKTQNWP